MYNKPGNQSPGNAPKRQGSNHANFIEALKSASIGQVKDTAKSFRDDLLVGSGQQMVDSLFNTNQGGTQNNPDQNEQLPPFNFSEYIHSDEVARSRGNDRVRYEYEQQETVIFNRRQQEVDKKIEEIKIELKRIKETIGNIETSTETVISQEVVSPGTYHLNFFERLLKFLRHMRKRVAESRHWAAMNQQRTTTKSYYWQQSSSKVSGTKYMLSQERQLATQTG